MKELSIEEKAYNDNYKVYIELINRLEDVKDAIKKQNYGIAMDILCKPYPKYQITTSTELKESEDERVKKRILLSLEKDLMATKNSGCDTQDLEQCIAWLEKQGEPTEINPSEFDSQLNRLLGQFKSLPKEELVSSLSFYLNVVQNDGTYKSDEKQGEQKPSEWSEEDDSKLKEVLYYIEYVNRTNVTFQKRDLVHLINWLKSLKGRYTWKPSDEQINLISEAIGFFGAHSAKGMLMIDLRNNIKKLKE